MRVEVYFNLHKKVFSVRRCSTGRVIMHSDHVHIRNPEFVVRKAGRERVLREGKKNVHAFVRGEITHFDDFNPDYDTDFSLVMYNPYKYETFVDVQDVLPVRTAKRALLEIRQVKPYSLDGEYYNRPYIYAEGVQ